MLHTVLQGDQVATRLLRGEEPTQVGVLGGHSGHSPPWGSLLLLYRGCVGVPETRHHGGGQGGRAEGVHVLQGVPAAGRAATATATEVGVRGPAACQRAPPCLASSTRPSRHVLEMWVPWCREGGSKGSYCKHVFSQFPSGIDWNICGTLYLVSLFYSV